MSTGIQYLAHEKFYELFSSFQQKCPGGRLQGVFIAYNSAAVDVLGYRLLDLADPHLWGPNLVVKIREAGWQPQDANGDDVVDMDKPQIFMRLIPRPTWPIVPGSYPYGYIDTEHLQDLAARDVA